MLPPSGIFTPADLDADLLLFAGGSGITPIMSITRTALRQGSGRIVLFYANRDENSVIFAAALTELAAEHPDRLLVVHWLESVQGLPTPGAAEGVRGGVRDVRRVRLRPGAVHEGDRRRAEELEFPRERRHQEKFVSLGGNPFGDLHDVEVGRGRDRGRRDRRGRRRRGRAPPPTSRRGRSSSRSSSTARRTPSTTGQPGTKLLEYLESKGVKAPYSCREGECSACACRLLEGEVKMLHNDVLDDEDLAEGIRLGCQSVPVTDTV